PKREIQTNSSRPVWFNKHLRNLERKVKTAFKHHQLSAASFARYNYLCETFSSAKQKAESNYISGLYENGKGNNFKQLWSYVRSESSPVDKLPSLIDSQGNVVYSSDQKAQLLNESYVKVFSPVTAAISEIPIAPMRDDLAEFSFSASSIENWIRKMPK